MPSVIFRGIAVVRSLGSRHFYVTIPLNIVRAYSLEGKKLEIIIREPPDSEFEVQPIPRIDDF